MKNFYAKLAGIAVLMLAASTTGWSQDLRITQAEAVKAAKDKTQPDYPPMAKQLHLEGSVQVQAYISESGAVEEVKPLTGNAILMNAAVSALKKWKFVPFTVDGKPSRAIADMSFSFKL